MPQATEGLRRLMNRWFGDPIDDGPPYRFLLARGWTEQAGLLIKPSIAYQPSPYEAACCIFLRDEWDFDFQPLWPYISDQGVYYDHLNPQGIPNETSIES